MSRGLSGLPARAARARSGIPCLRGRAGIEQDAFLPRVAASRPHDRRVRRRAAAARATAVSRTARFGGNRGAAAAATCGVGLLRITCRRHPAGPGHDRPEPAHPEDRPARGPPAEKRAGRPRPRIVSARDPSRGRAADQCRYGARCHHAGCPYRRDREGTPAGVTLRPVFLGRGDRLDSARWGAPLLRLGGTSVSARALLLSLAGDFLGCVVIENGSPAVAGARDVLAIVDRLATAPTMSPATLGVSVQPLTPSLASALRADRGVVVANVDPAGPAADALRPGDVLTAFAGMPVNDVERFLVQVAASPIDVPIAASVLRAGQTREIQLVPAAATRRDTERKPLAFQRLRDGVTRAVRQAGQTGYVDTGLQDGDIVVAAAGLPDPTPAQLRRVLETAQSGTLIPFTIRRGGEQRMIAVRAGA